MGYRDIKTAYIYIYTCTYKSPEVIEVLAPGSMITLTSQFWWLLCMERKMMSTKRHVRQAGDQRITKKFQGGEPPIGIAMPATDMHSFDAPGHKQGNCAAPTL